MSQTEKKLFNMEIKERQFTIGNGKYVSKSFDVLQFCKSDTGREFYILTWLMLNLGAIFLKRWGNVGLDDSGVKAFIFARKTLVCGFIDLKCSLKITYDFLSLAFCNKTILKVCNMYETNRATFNMPRLSKWKSFHLKAIRNSTKLRQQMLDFTSPFSVNVRKNNPKLICSHMY